jgi:hypothetical protein
LGIYPNKKQMNDTELCYSTTFPTTQSDFPRPLAEQGHSAVLEGNFLGRNRSAWRVPEAIVEVVVGVANIVDVAEAVLVVGVANIVDVAEAVLVVGRAVGIGVGVVDAVGQAENTTQGSRVEVQKVQSRAAGGQGERPGFAVEWGRIVEVVANMIVVVADGVCRALVAVAGIESIVVDMQLREVPAEGMAVERMAGAG